MENQKIEELKQRGYSPVWVYDSAPNEEDPGHAHPYDTHLIVIKGEIEIKMDGKVEVLKVGDEADILRGKVHSAKSAANGCKYIVAEKY